MAPAAATLAQTSLVLGRYRPVRPLGSGGSGSVWLARDEVSGVDVALKIVAREGKAASRAEREAGAAARLRHPRCLRAYALAHDADHVYIAYEYVPGETLRDALRAGRIDDAAAVEAAAQMLDGLAHAHAHGILHRDVKPANVLLADADAISVRLLDFGLARMDEADTLTAVGDVPGTLAYIAPERLAGEPASPASDVWSVGVVLWETLAGTHPFWKPSLLESARAIEDGAPPLATMRPDLPRPLLAAVDRALSSDPRRRPRADRLARALRAVPDRRERAPRRPVPALPAVATRVAPALLAAVLAGLGASVLPFFPAGWAAAAALGAGGVTLVRERLGLALAIAAPVFPLGNLSLGLALAYGALAIAWLALFAREPRGGLLVALGPLLGPVGALGLLPLAASAVRSPVRRAAAVAGAMLTAAVAAGVRASPLPLMGERPPGTLGIAGSEDAVAAADAVRLAVAAHPGLLAAGLALGAAAAALPYARARGDWAVAAWGAGTLALALLPVPGVAALPLVAAVWATCAFAWLAPRVRAGRVLPNGR